MNKTKNLKNSGLYQHFQVKYEQIPQPHKFTAIAMHILDRYELFKEEKKRLKQNYLFSLRQINGKMEEHLEWIKKNYSINDSDTQPTQAIQAIQPEQPTRTSRPGLRRVLSGPRLWIP